MSIKQETITKELIKKYIPDNPIILEAGAHIGRDTKKMALLWPGSIIHAFEPVPELYAELSKLSQNYNNIITYNLALSNNKFKTNFWVSSGRSTALSSLLKPKISRTSTQTADSTNLINHPETVFTLISVQAITLDQWALENNINKIDFMWLDLQGAELMALESGLKILSTVKTLLIEASLEERYENDPQYSKLKKWIESQSFKAIYQDFPNHGKVNILFIKN